MSTATAPRRAIAPNGVMVKFEHVTGAGWPHDDGWWLVITAPSRRRNGTPIRAAGWWQRQARRRAGQRVQPADPGPVRARVWLGRDLDATHAGQVLAETAAALGPMFRFSPARLTPLPVQGWRDEPDIPRFGGREES